MRTHIEHLSGEAADLALDTPPAGHPYATPSF
jgi:hypothetical protein